MGLGNAGGMAGSPEPLPSVQANSSPSFFNHTKDSFPLTQYSQQTLKNRGPITNQRPALTALKLLHN